LHWFLNAVNELSFFIDWVQYKTKKLLFEGAAKLLDLLALRVVAD
jgi:hypothetical protein